MQQGGDIDGELANDRAGWSVSLNSDGLVVAVGAPLNDGNGSKSGHVRVYKLISGIWIQQGLDIDGEATLDESGGTVSLSNDGLTVAIGAKKNDGNGSNSGHVRVYSMFADLPISLVNFDATAKNNNYIQLTWQTASEINNDYFTIEKSKDGLNWVFVNEQPGAGNNNTLLNYTAIDNNPYQGVSYYRLKQTDFNEDYSYSAIRAVSIATNNTISIYPNPTSDNFILSINGNNEEITMEIYNSIGLQVMIKRFTTKDTPLNKKITTNQLPNGVYYVSIKTGKIIETQKLIISK